MHRHEPGRRGCVQSHDDCDSSGKASIQSQPRRTPAHDPSGLTSRRRILTCPRRATGSGAALFPIRSPAAPRHLRIPPALTEMSNPYESRYDPLLLLCPCSPGIVDHNLKPDETAHRPRRRPSMSSFFSHLAQVERAPTPHNPHATPTPVDMAAAERLLQDQLNTFRVTASSATHEAFLQSLIASLELDIDHPPTVVPGVSQDYLDKLERVSRKVLMKGEECKICGEEFLADDYCLVVQLPCHPLHRFDLECIGPWLRLQGTCPVDRQNLERESKMRLEKIALADPMEDEYYDDMFA